MKFTRQQRGMSIWVVMYILATLGAFGLVGLKLLPIYLESHKIEKALHGVITEPQVSKLSKREIQELLLKRFDIDSVTRIHHRNIKDYVQVASRGQSVTINIDYRAEAPLVANVLLVADFKMSVTN